MAFAVLLGLTACTSTEGAAPSSSAAASATAGASDSATEPGAATPSAATTLAPGGSAAEDQPFFDQTIQALLDDKDKPTGRQFIDALVDAGFDKSLMEVTADKTSIGLAADAIEFSVRLGDDCIVGQKGAEFGYSSVVLPVLDSGTCLLGKTRTIDW